MLKKDVLAYFDPGRMRLSVTARALGITVGAVSQWDKLVPELTARKIAEITRGQLKFRGELYDRRRPAA